MRTLALLLLALAADVVAQPSTKNDDSCDISVQPAATLLLPHFEVDVHEPQRIHARTTLFTVVNTVRSPQIARVTIWTDLAYPVLDFDLFLTGYDVHAVDLYDVLVHGRIAPPDGLSNASTPGQRSLSNLSGNANFLPSAAENCSTGSMPRTLPEAIAEDLRSSLTSGVYSPCGSARVGTNHNLAIGYVTIDVVATCAFAQRWEPRYYSDLLLFDNVLTGDYEILDPQTSVAQGGAMVHIRAVPEGGAAGSRTAANLPYTFYDNFTSHAANVDRRQPLPHVFAARYVSASVVATRFTIWREAFTGPIPRCSAALEQANTPVADIVRSTSAKTRPHLRIFRR